MLSENRHVRDYDDVPEYARTAFRREKIADLIRDCHPDFSEVTPEELSAGIRETKFIYIPEIDDRVMVCCTLELWCGRYAALLVFESGTTRIKVYVEKTADPLWS